MIKTLLKDFISKVENAETRADVYDIVNGMSNEFMMAVQDCPQCWSVNTRWTGYGTWRVSLWLNNYHFGDRMASYDFSFITHDEEKVLNNEFSCEDFQRQLDEYLQDYAIAIWEGDEEPEKF
jgi:hypothetical protein